MSTIIDWIKEHVSPYAKIPDDQGPFPQREDENNSESTEDKIEDEIKKTEVGIKFTWKW